MHVSYRLYVNNPKGILMLYNYMIIIALFRIDPNGLKEAKGYSTFLHVRLRYVYAIWNL